MAYNNDNLAVAIHDTDNIITEENIEECVVDYWTQRVKDFSDVREHELNSDMGKEWLEEIISNISMYTAYDKKSSMSSGADITENSRIKVLDVGTGVGYFAILLNRCGMDVIGIDLTPDMITRAKELADKYGADVTYEVMDAMELSYADETFDVVITRNLTWTLPDIQKAYKEWHRVLKKGGLLLNYDANYARMNSLEKTIIKDDDKTAPYGHQGMTQKLEEKNALIAQSMDIGKHERPAYDVHILEKMGYKNCIIDPAFGKRVLKEKDLKEAPMFMIMAGK